MWIIICGWIMTSQSAKLKINDLHEAHPRIRAKDWRSPLIKRLLPDGKYKDGSCDVADSFRSPAALKPTEQSLTLSWAGLKEDFDQTVRTYQEPVITEFATLGLACMLVAERARFQITEVTRRGEKADYWLDDKRLLLEVSGQQSGNLDDLCSEKPINCGKIRSKSQVTSALQITITDLPDCGSTLPQRRFDNGVRH
jgi:hypothetical protein